MLLVASFTLIKASFVMFIVQASPVTVIYYCNMFIVQATVVAYLSVTSKKKVL
jgi:hypothetical protein